MDLERVVNKNTISSCFSALVLIVHYIHQLLLLWHGAGDTSVPCLDGYTVETRIEEWIKEVALTGRAHNYDGAEKDDYSQGDEPSCYPGMRKRFAQALKGHPSMVQGFAGVIEHEIRDAWRGWFSTRLEKTNTQDIESLASTCHEVAVEPGTEFGVDWDMPQEAIEELTQHLETKYALHPEKESIQGHVALLLKDKTQQPYPIDKF